MGLPSYFVRPRLFRFHVFLQTRSPTDRAPDAIQGKSARTEAHHDVRLHRLAGRFCAARYRSPIWLVAPAFVDHNLFTSGRFRRVRDDTLGCEGQPFRCEDDSGRARSGSDFQRPVSHRSPSNVFGRMCDVAVHAFGARIVPNLACLRSPHSVDRSSSPQRRKSFVPRIVRVCGILHAHPLPAHSLCLVSDIFFKARR